MAQWRVANADLVKERMPPDGQTVRSDRGRKSGIIGFWGRVPFHGRAVRANDRRRRDLTFLEEETEGGEKCNE